jgi:hypothetical protein
MKRMVMVLVAMLWCSLGAIAAAAPDEATLKVARSHFEKGNAAYNLGKFDEAIGWYTKAYEAWPNPDFLYNVAQAHRQAGHCSQALYLYNRYLQIKEREKEDALSKEERTTIERFIKELTDCEKLIKAKPDGPKSPSATSSVARTAEPGSPAPSAGPIVSPASATPPAGSAPALTAPTATLEQRADTGDDEPAAAPSAPTLVSMYATGGVAMFSTRGELSISAQPSFGLGAGYPVAIGPILLDVGARASYSPIPYVAMNMTTRASLVGVRATVGATYRVNARLAVRGDAGLGVLLLRGLVAGNALTDDATAGAFTMPSVRLGVAAEYAVMPNLVATVAPLGVGFSPASDRLAFRSLTQLDVLVGLGYRM